MNEQINKLLEASKLTDVLIQHASEYGQMPFDANDYPEVEQFAELIVYDILNELTNDDSLRESRIAAIQRLAERYGVAR